MRRPLILTLLLATGIPSQGNGQSLSQLRKAFRSENSIEVRREVLKQLQGQDSSKLAKALIQAYRQLESEAEPLVARRHQVLSQGGGARPLRPLRESLQALRNLQIKIRGLLGSMTSPAACRSQVQSFIQPRRPLPLSLRLCLAEAAAKLSNQDLDTLLAKPKERRRSAVEDRCLFCKAIGRAGRRAAHAAPRLISWLDAEELELREAAINALAATAAPQGLPALIARLDQERGRIRDRVLQTLQQLTGANPGPSTSSWKQWLAKEGTEFVSGKRPMGNKKPPRRLAPRKGTGAYFGIPQDGKSILYVFDNSKSMQAIMPRTTGQSRMQRCKQELKKALRALSKDKTFNLLCFANRLQQFADKMQPASRSKIDAACAWIDNIEMQLHTNSFDALEQAFYLAGRGVADRHYPLAADTMFFLSDGAPTRPNPPRGLGQDKIPEILEAVRRWNGLGRVMIHSVGLGIRKKGRPANFMRRLAEENGGIFVIPR